MNRIRFFTHRGKQILHLDFSNCDEDEVLVTIEEAKKVIRIHPPQSILTLTNVEGAHYNMKVTNAMMEFAHGNKPFVKAGAVIGISGLKKIVYDAVMKFSGRNLPAFDHIEKAKDWLSEQ
jgi:hypothetical protein